LFDFRLKIREEENPKKTIAYGRKEKTTMINKYQMVIINMMKLNKKGIRFRFLLRS